MKPKEYVKKYGTDWDPKNEKDFLIDLLEDFRAQVGAGRVRDSIGRTAFLNAMKQHREKFDRIRALMTVPPPEEIYDDLGLDIVRDKLFPPPLPVRDPVMERLITYAMLGGMLRNGGER